MPRSDLPVPMQYAYGVLDGRIPVCENVRLAVERHINDLEHGHERGLRFSEEHGQHVLDFFRYFLVHHKGEWAGQAFTLSPWQQFQLWVLFGWLKEDGTRRFRVSYEEVARKNGKTTKAAGVGLYLFDADGEPGAEVYSAATKRDQAKICHDAAKSMIKASPHLRSRIGIFKNNIHCLNTGSKFEPLGRDADNLDGLNIHGGLCDEVHAWKQRDLWDVIETATAARRQSLLYAITTAGFNRQSICWELHDYTIKVLTGVVDDDSWFGMIFTLDEEDDWENEELWVKANPNLGISVKIDDLRRKAVKAKKTPSALNAFLRLHMNQWTQAESRWLPPEAWRACSGKVDAEALRGRTCYGGLDLSSTRDLSAFVMVFPPEMENEPYQALCRFWIPEENMHERSRRDRVPYEAWHRAGLIQATPGNVIDYGFILESIDKDAQAFDLKEVAFDRWGATKIIQELEERGLTVVQFGQGFASMSPPTKELEKMVLAVEIAHGGHPVLTWMADNVVVRQDPAGNLKPDKAKSLEKIDGIVALIMGLDRALRHEDQTSVYETRGLLTF